MAEHVIPGAATWDLARLRTHVWPEHQIVGNLARHGRSARLVPGSLRVEGVQGQCIAFTFAWVSNACCADDCESGSDRVALPCRRRGHDLGIDLGVAEAPSTHEEF